MRSLLLALLIEAAVLGAGFQAGMGAGRGQPASGVMGRVVDPAGRPVGDVFVTALTPAALPQGFAFVSARLGAVTDRSGRFTLPVGPGEVWLVALPHNQPRDASGRPNRSGFGRTFYPATAVLAEARTVLVKAGVPSTAEIVLQPARLASITGRVTDASGQPVGVGRLRVAHGDGLFGLDSSAVQIGTSGRFSVPGLAPGTYCLHFNESTSTTGPAPRWIVSRAIVRVDGEDRDDVHVSSLPMVRVTGRLLIPSGSRSRLDPTLIRVGASPVSFDCNPGPQAPEHVNDDLTFGFRTWPSRGRVRVTLEAPGWSVRAVRLNGVDVTGKPVEFVAGQPLRGLEIELVERR